jgi:hypothetical protein
MEKKLLELTIAYAEAKAHSDEDAEHTGERNHALLDSIATEYGKTLKAFIAS